MKRKKNLHIVLGFLFLVSAACEAPIEPIRIFKIEQGKHYCTQRLTETFQNDVLSFDALFDASAIYDLGDNALQSNKNKLLGFSDCNSLHHENSARFAWQWFNDQLEIYAYTYVNGEQQEAFVGTVNLNVFNHYRITLQHDHYEFQLNNGPIVQMARGSACKRGFYYKLWPYFGGAVPAPHDIFIQIKYRY